MKVGQPLSIFCYFLFSDPFVDRASNLFDEAELEEVLDSDKAVLEDILVLGIVI